MIFTAVRKSVLNTAGFRALGVTPQTTEFHGGRIVRDEAGAPVLIVVADAYLTKAHRRLRVKYAGFLHFAVGFR